MCTPASETDTTIASFYVLSENPLVETKKRRASVCYQQHAYLPEELQKIENYSVFKFELKKHIHKNDNNTNDNPANT